MKYKVSINERGKKSVQIGQYQVTQDKKTFNGVYDYDGILKTSSTSWRKAVKMAKFLNSAYKEGQDSMRNEYLM